MAPERLGFHMVTPLFQLPLQVVAMESGTSITLAMTKIAFLASITRTWKPGSLFASSDKSYKEWKRVVHVLVAGEGGSVTEVMGPRTMTCLKGRAAI